MRFFANIVGCSQSRSVCCPCRKGFTLIELSIVLVIIGLIVGGVMAGRGIYDYALMRSQISQLKSFSLATKAFRLKYNQLPGDLTPAYATAFGFKTRSGAFGHGDNNGMIEPCFNGFQTSRTGCEHLLFWTDLSQAGMIGFTFTAGSDNYAASLTSATLPLYYPTAKLTGNYIIAWASPPSGAIYNTDNWFSLTGITGTNGSGDWSSLESHMNASQAYFIDSKVDDGLPDRGSIIAFRPSTNDMANAGGTDCVVALTRRYEVSNNNNGCGLNVSQSRI